MRGHLAGISVALRNLTLFTFVTGDSVSHKDPRVSNVHSSSSQSTLTAARAIVALCLILTPCLEIELSSVQCHSLLSAGAHCTLLIHCWMSRAAGRRLVTGHYGSWSPGGLVTLSVVSSGPCHHPPSYVKITSGIGCS